ncbi:regulatory protein RecX [Chitinophagaceae bacterium MMS25-I14]
MDVQTAIYRYCNYQERCHYEVRNKLYELGAKTPEVEELISELIEKGLLNEERFARAFAGGRFRMKHWGRKKIIQELKLRKISDFCIRKAMLEINPDDYDKTLERLAEKKWSSLRQEKNELVRKAKLLRYLLQKGYETDLIKDITDKLGTQDKGL